MLDGQNRDAAKHEGDRDGRHRLGQLHAGKLGPEAADARDGERSRQLVEVVAILWYREAQRQVEQPPPINDDHAKNRTDLNRNVEEIGARTEPMLRDQQVAGARDGQKLGDALDDAEDDGLYDFFHDTALATHGRR